MKKVILVLLVSLLSGCFNKYEELANIQKKHPNAIVIGRGESLTYIYKDSSNRVIAIKNKAFCAGVDFEPTSEIVLIP